MTRDSAYLRGQLASIGILLDPPTPAAIAATTGTALPAPDRAEVRRILESAGAPARDLEWLTESCPSIEDALGYQPPPAIQRRAWCLECGDATLCDDDGCLNCRGALVSNPTPRVERGSR